MKTLINILLFGITISTSAFASNKFDMVETTFAQFTKSECMKDAKYFVKLVSLGQWESVKLNLNHPNGINDNFVLDNSNTNAYFSSNYDQNYSYTLGEFTISATSVEDKDITGPTIEIGVTSTQCNETISKTGELSHYYLRNYGSSAAHMELSVYLLSKP